MEYAVLTEKNLNLYTVTLDQKLFRTIEVKVRAEDADTARRAVEEMLKNDFDYEAENVTVFPPDPDTTVYPEGCDVVDVEAEEEDT